MTKRIPLHTHKVWAVAADTLCCGWQPGTIEHDGQTYPDIYLTQRAADVEVADMIRERLERFIEDAGEYDGLEDALACGFEAVEAEMGYDGQVYIADILVGRAPPDIRAAILTNDRSRKRKEQHHAENQQSGASSPRRGRRNPI
jgi:hypothetical protein